MEDVSSFRPVFRRRQCVNNHPVTLPEDEVHHMKLKPAWLRIIKASYAEHTHLPEGSEGERQHVGGLGKGTGGETAPDSVTCLSLCLSLARPSSGCNVFRWNTTTLADASLCPLPRPPPTRDDGCLSNQSAG